MFELPDLAGKPAETVALETGAHRGHHEFRIQHPATRLAGTIPLWGAKEFAGETPVIMKLIQDDLECTFTTITTRKRPLLGCEESSDQISAIRYDHL